MRQNTDQRNSECKHYLRSDWFTSSIIIRWVLICSSCICMKTFYTIFSVEKPCDICLVFKNVHISINEVQLGKLMYFPYFRTLFFHLGNWKFSEKKEIAQKCKQEENFFSDPIGESGESQKPNGIRVGSMFKVSINEVFVVLLKSFKLHHALLALHDLLLLLKKLSEIKSFSNPCQEMQPHTRCLKYNFLSSKF